MIVPPIHADYGSTVHAWSGSTVYADYGRTVHARSGSTVHARSGSTVHAWSGSTVYAPKDAVEVPWLACVVRVATGGRINKGPEDDASCPGCHHSWDDHGTDEGQYCVAVRQGQSGLPCECGKNRPEADHV